MGYWSIAVTALLFASLLLVDLRCRDFRWLPLYGAFFAVHPAWTIGVMGGDCGFRRRFFSAAICLVFAGILLLRVNRPDFSRRFFVVILAACCWQAYLGTWVYWYRPFEPRPNAFLAAVFESAPVQAFAISMTNLLAYALMLSVLALLAYVLQPVLRRFNAV